METHVSYCHCQRHGKSRSWSITAQHASKNTKNVNHKIRLNLNWSLVFFSLPAFQLVVNDTNHPKILLIPGSGIPKQSKARAGINPYHVEPKYPKIEKKQRKNLPPEIKAKVKKFEDYQKHKNDMSVLALAMGPDFKEDYVLYDPIEIVDFYQIICFLLRVSVKRHADQKYKSVNSSKNPVAVPDSDWAPQRSVGPDWGDADNLRGR